MTDERKPVTISCIHCGETIYEGQEWSWGWDGEPPYHIACEDRERDKAREASKLELERLRAKEAVHEELTFDEVVTLTMADQVDAFRNAMLESFAFRGPGAVHLSPADPIEKLPGFIQPTLMFASVRISKEDPDVDPRP